MTNHIKTIKRYPNRLLYDADIRQFVTGNRLREYVRRGIDFRIVDNRSGDDMTVKVLGQVLLDDLNEKNNKQSVIEIMRGYIALGGDFSMDILKKTVLASIGAFEITKSKAEEIVDALIKQGEVAKSKRSDAILELLEKAEGSTKEFKDKISRDVESAIENMKVAKKKDLQDLSDKVDQLAEQVRKLTEKLE